MNTMTGRPFLSVSGTVMFRFKHSVPDILGVSSAVPMAHCISVFCSKAQPSIAGALGLVGVRNVVLNIRNYVPVMHGINDVCTIVGH
jgi:hypothetical protein